MSTTCVTDLTMPLRMGNFLIIKHPKINLYFIAVNLEDSDWTMFNMGPKCIFYSAFDRKYSAKL